MKIGEWELSELEAQRLADSRRELQELLARKPSKFKNAAEALEALADVFGSDEELEAFGRHIRRMRDEEWARYRD